MDALSQLLARKTTILADLASMTKLTVGGKPNASGDGAMNVDHVGWRKSLLDELKMINELILQEEQVVDAQTNSNSWEVITE